MGWKENGKFGVTTGRTVRSPFASSRGYLNRYLGVRGDEVVLKFTRGTGHLSSDEMKNFLRQNDIDDGLGDFTEFTTRLVRAQDVDRSCNVQYSLNKRKRWRLAENVRGLEDTKDTAPNVTFIHRVDNELAADCFEVVRAKEGEVLQPKKRKYARVQDLLKKSDKAELEPEVCYEMTHHYPRNEYPQCKEVHSSDTRWSSRWYDASPGKALCKNKGVKNKGHRWGLHSDADLRSAGKIAKEKPVLQRTSQHNTSDCKVKVIDSMEFSKFNDCEGRSLFCGSLDFGLYMQDSSKIPRKQSKKNKHKPDLTSSTENGSLRHYFKYGKNSVMYQYIEQEPDKKSSEDMSFSAIGKTPQVQSVPTCQVFQPENNVLATVPVYVGDLERDALRENWHCLYSEAKSFPRKFTVDLGPVLHENMNENIYFCFVLFEEINAASSGMASMATNVSLNIAGTEESDTVICEANAKFCSELQRGGKKTWRVQNVVDCALECLRDLLQPLQLPTRKTTSHCQKTWRSLQLLGDMFGWKSKVFTPKQMKTELITKIKNLKETQCEIDIDCCSEPDSFSVRDTLGVSNCGICSNELGNVQVASFTALNACRHVFCNECWEAHLKMQISIGNTDLQCPGYKCDVGLDDITIIALIPSWYSKYMSRKLDRLANCEFQFCPSKDCGRAVKATTSDFNAMEMNPVPVGCTCGSLWCFRCRRPAHWPASCAADKKFHEVSKQYLTEMELNQEEMITSVLVRNCPNCHYPIEKHLGCSFMYCIMCQTAFCWECLTPMINHKQGCQRKEQSKEIELEDGNTGTNHFIRYFTVYCENKRARSSMTLSRQRKRLRLVEETIARYKSIHSSHSYFNQTVDKVLQTRCHEILRSAVEFTYGARLTLEGAAKVAVISRSTCRSGLQQDMERLQFIVEKIDALAKNDTERLLRCNNLDKLSDFLLRGRDCVLKIGWSLTRQQINWKLN